MCVHVGGRDWFVWSLWTKYAQGFFIALWERLEFLRLASTRWILVHFSKLIYVQHFSFLKLFDLAKDWYVFVQVVHLNQILNAYNNKEETDKGNGG